MADAGSFNADLGLNLNLSLDNAGVAKVTNTLKEIAKGKDLQRYWKDVETATDNATKAMERYSRNTSSSKLAERFLKEINALKAISGNENLSKLFPKIDLNIDGLIESAKKIAPTINSEFSISNFSSAFKTFDLLKEQGLDLTDVFRKLSEYAELVSKNIDLKRENSSYRELLGDKDIQSVQNYQNALEKLRKEAEEIFESFLKVNHISRTDFWGDEKFGEYFSSIKEGTMTATEAISTFKAEYSYLLKGDSTKNGFGLDALQEFSTKLTNILREVEDVSTKINDILSNGVITKSMQNLSMDSTLSDSQRSLFSNLLKDEETLKTITSLFQNLIEESNKTRNATLFDEEQFSRLLILFEKIESSLSSMKAVFVDVGDGEEFSPLLKMINNVQESVGKLSSSAKNIGLNMNIDVGSNKELETRFQEKASKALIAYQRLFDHIKSTTTSQSIFEEFNKFNLDNFDTTYGKAKAIANFIERARNDSKTLYNNHDVLKEDTSSTYWKQASASMAQATKVLNEMRASSNVNPLENLFGKTDLTEVISQLNRIVEKLSEISSTASEFKNTFANGFNISASVEEIEKLTSRVKELENELSKVKISSTSPVKTNISSGNGVIKELETIDAKEDEIISKTQKMYRAFNSTHGVSGKGISWFTDELETAESYIESRGKDRIAQLVTDTNKFLTIDGNGSSFNKILYEGIERTTDELAEMAKQAGYAGIAINNIYDSFSGSTDIKPSNIFAIFDENIIKKATDVTETIRVEASIKNINSLISETNEKLELEKNNQKELNALLDDYNNGRKISPEDKNYIEDGTLQKSLEDSIKASEAYERKLESLNSELSKLQSSTPIKDTFQGDAKSSAESSAPAIKEEAKAMEQVAENAEKASKGKEKFAKANKNVKASADASTGSIEKENSALDEKVWEKNLKVIQEYMDANTKLNKLNAKDKGTGKHASDIARQEKEVEKLRESALEARTVLSSMINPHDVPIEDWNKWIEAMEKFEQATKGSAESVAKLEDALRSARNAQLSSIDSTINNSQSKLDNFSKKKAQSDAYKNSLIELGVTIERLRTLRASLSNTRAFTDEEQTQIQALTKDVHEYINAIKNMPAGEKGSDALSRDKWANRIREYMDKNTRLTREFREELENLIRILRTGGDSVVLKDVIGQFEDAKFRIKEAKLEGKSFFDIFKDKAVYGFAAKLANYYLSFYDFIRYGRYAINTVVELNTQMINLSKVSEQSVSQISDDFSSYAKTAKEVGATISDTISATTNWAKNGYNIPDSQELAEVALIYKNVGDIDIESANESLISTIRGFKLEAEDAMRVIDVFNEVSNNEAISAGGIGEALKRSAASFSAANTSLEQSVALITATRLQNWLNAWKHVLRIYLIAIEVFITMHHNIEETTI